MPMHALATSFRVLRSDAVRRGSPDDDGVKFLKDGSAPTPEPDFVDK